MTKATLSLIALFLSCLVSAQDVAPTASLKITTKSPEVGKPIQGVVNVSFADGLHAYQNPPTKEFMIPLTVQGVGGTKVKAKYPKGTLFKSKAEPEGYMVYQGSISVPVTFEPPKKGGKVSLKVELNLQQCNDQNCFGPRKIALSAPVDIKEAAGTVTPPKIGPMGDPGMPEPNMGKAEPTPAGPDTPVSSDQPKAQEAPVDNPKTDEPAKAPVKEAAPAPKGAGTTDDDGDWLSRFIRDSFKQGNYLLVILAALGTGLLLAITPCVYPMIPITVSFFGNQTGGSRANKLGLGLVYTLGIAITYGAVGGVAAGLGGMIGSLFQSPYFNLGVAILLGALALSMFGLYEIGLPPAIGKQLKSRAGIAGAFIMGLLMGFVAAPCAGPFVVAIAVEVAKQKSVGLGVLVFTFIGVGLGLPFMFLAMLSAGAKALPRSGGWLSVVKAVLGIVVLALGFKYLLQAGGEIPALALKSGKPNTFLAWGVFYLGFAAYMAFIDKSSGTKAVSVIKGAAIIVLSLLAGMQFADRGTAINAAEMERVLAKTKGVQTAQVAPTWVKYSDAVFEEAKKSGKPIFIDGTAEWCTLCHEIKEQVLDTPEGKALLSNVVTIELDLTKDTPENKAISKKFNIVGLPHLMFFKPGGEPSKTVNKLESVAELKKILEESGAKL